MQLYSFDADGTLTDTARAHVMFCNDLAVEGNYDLPAMDENDPRTIKKVFRSPMREFFRAYGYPESDLDKLVLAYQERFNKDPKYSSKPFPGVDRLSKMLSGRSSIITANTADNVKAALGELFYSFAFCFDIHYLKLHCDGKKEKALLKIAETQGVPPSQITYVGDAEKDFLAAQAAGCKFIGAAYGWQINFGDPRFPTARNIDELLAIINAEQKI